jgi:hypothetical protein
MDVAEKEFLAKFDSEVAIALERIHGVESGRELVAKYDVLVGNEAFRREPCVRLAALRIVRAEEFRTKQRLAIGRSC